MKAITATRLIWRAFAQGDTHARYCLLEAIGRYCYAEFVMPDFGCAWMADSVFRQWHLSCGNPHLRSLDRKYALKELLKLVHNIPGDTAECGVYNGTSSYLVCEANRGSSKTHFLFDSFEGLSKPVAEDGVHWQAHDLSLAESACRANLSGFTDVRFLKGWIPERFSEVASRRFSFVHIDVDLYEPTRDSVQFFYTRLSPGGLLVCDDYGSSLCPGAKLALDEFFADKAEPIVALPTQQALVIKT